MRNSTTTNIKDKKQKARKSTLSEELIASEVRYRRLFESAKDGILILDAKTGKIVDVNPFLIDLLGYTKQDFIEKSIWDIGSFHDIYDNKEKFLELQQNKYVRYDDLPIQTSTGRKIHVEFVSNVYLEDRREVIQCNIRDITENWQMKNQIVESEEKFRTITENSADAIFITDKDGNYIYVNKQAVKLLGYSKEELLTLSLADISPKHRIAEYFKIFQQLFITGSSYTEIELVRKDGSCVDTDLNAVWLPNGWIYGSCRDISNRKQLEHELVKSKEKAEESDRLKSAFLANMSHEIRTPMNGILGFTELLKNLKLKGEEQQEYIKIIEKSGTRMLNIINDIISISKIESHQVEITYSYTNINAQVEYIYHFFKPEAEQKKLNFSFKNGLPVEEAVIKTDREKVYAILTNLVKNAMKFTHDGFIEMGYLKKDGFLEFYVKDSGSGISFDQKEFIFERFRQGSITITHNYEGAGLGLSISKAYVEMLGGKIWVENNNALPSVNGNRLNKGSTFYFTLPVNSLQKSEISSSDYSAASEIKIHTRKLKVLIVEDDKTSELLIRILLEKNAKEFLHASNGVEAIESCKNNPDIDLVLMDINLPEMDGYEATRKIREFNVKVIIIAQTAYALAGDREKSLLAGCNDYISKPINRITLSNLMAEYFE